MPVWLSVLVAVVAALAGTASIVTLVAKLGAFGGSSQSEIKALSDRVRVNEQEIDRLRDWRHTVGNLQQSMAAMDMVMERIKRLELKVFNGIQK